jgi:hypothetical protein
MLSTLIAKIRPNYARMQLQSSEAKQSIGLYRDLKELTLDRFIECYCNDNLSKLVKFGEPTAEELQEAWDEIFTQYIEIIGGEEVQDKLKLIRDMNFLSMKVERIGALLDVLSVAPTEGLFEQLFAFGYNLPKMPYNEDSIKALSKIITAHMKRDVVEVQILSDRLKKETGEQKRQTESDFYALIVEISDMFKVVLKESETSVMAFAMYINKYKQKAEAINRKNKQHSNG